MSSTNHLQGLVAFVFMVICASTQIYPSQEIYSELFVVPIAAVFALTSLRSNLPGAPTGFGELFPLTSLHYNLIL